MSACRITTVVLPAICKALMSCMLFIGRSSHYMVFVCVCVHVCVCACVHVCVQVLLWIALISPRICFCYWFQPIKRWLLHLFCFFFTSHLYGNCTHLYCSVKYVNGHYTALLVIGLFCIAPSPSVCPTVNQVVKVYLCMPFWRLAQTCQFT